MIARCVILAALICTSFSQSMDDISERTVVFRVEPRPNKPPYMNHMNPPHAVSQQNVNPLPQSPPSQEPVPAPIQVPSNRPPMAPPVQQPAAVNSQLQFPGASPPGTAPVVAAQTPVFNGTNSELFLPRNVGQATPPPPPPLNIPPDVQNQLIKFFGLDSFGIPGLTGSHPKGFAGAVQELRAAGIPVQGLPADHAGGQIIRAPQSGKKHLIFVTFVSDRIFRSSCTTKSRFCK